MKRSESISNLCFVLVLLLALTTPGCSRAEPPDFVGIWEVDPTDMQRVIDERVAANPNTPDLRERLENANRETRWIIRSDGTYTHFGAFPSEGNYRVYDHGEDWVVIRLLPNSFLGDETSEDLEEYERLNRISDDELVEYFGSPNGNAPLLRGFQLLPNGQAREFSLRVRDSNITDERDEGVLFNRVD